MLSEHIPHRLGQITRDIADTDAATVVEGMVAIAVLGLLAAYMFGVWA